MSNVINGEACSPGTLTMNLFGRLLGATPSPPALVCVAAMCLCAAACSHLDPYETTGPKRPGADDRRRVLPPSAIAEPDERGTRYVSAMHEALERVDADRVGLQGLIARIGTERNVYDAALWLTLPLVAFDPAPKDMVKAAAVLGAGYAYLNARPKEQVPIFESAIAQLTCLMIAYSPYLYTDKDFGELAPDGRHSRRYDRLVEATAQFESATGRFIDAVPVIQPSTPPIQCDADDSPDCAARRKLRARTRPGNQRQIDLYRNLAGRRIEEAGEETSALATLEDRILRRAPFELSVRAHQVMDAARRSQYAVQAPPLAADAFINGHAVAGQPAAPGGAATAQSGRRTPRIGTGLPVPAGAGAALRNLRERADAADRDLAHARREAQVFVAAHDARLADARSAAREHCGPSAPAAAGAATQDGRAEPARVVPLER
jgi:hypothetical protein